MFALNICKRFKSKALSCCANQMKQNMKFSDDVQIKLRLSLYSNVGSWNSIFFWFYFIFLTPQSNTWAVRRA